MRGKACLYIRFLRSSSFWLNGLIALSASGIILGSGHDDSGASIPGATITIVNQQMGFRREALTDSNGDYEVPYVNSPLTEKPRLQIRAEGLNVLNNFNFALPNINPGSAAARIDCQQYHDFTADPDGGESRVLVPRPVSPRRVHWCYDEPSDPGVPGIARWFDERLHIIGDRESGYILHALIAELPRKT
jgi:hypothetical protein